MDHLNDLIRRYPRLEPIRADIKTAFEIISESFSKGGKLLIAGNGGSASDAEHMVGELMKSFIKPRKLQDDIIANMKKIDAQAAEYLAPRLQQGLPAIALCGHASLNMAIINDINGDITFAQQLCGYGKEGDVFLGISASGNAKNVYYAAVAAKAKNIKTIGLSGASGGILVKQADLSIIVPENEVYKIQELHLPVYHTLCLMLEEHFFP